MRFFRWAVAVLLALVCWGAGVSPAFGDVGARVDSDHDGLSDALEQRLLVQFAPTFLVGKAECAGVPAEFAAGERTPRVEAENGTIYGQVFPAKRLSGETPAVEVHFYHLWRKDCGAHGHPLDTEHVAVLLQGSGGDAETATWKATYWYAAAHERTVCDVSQIARASTIHAEDRGATVWISPGKHASYLNETLCQRGCGADRCEAMTALRTSALINLGEPGQPMNGTVFSASTAWPLAAKMAETNFPAEPIGRLERLPNTDIAWFSPGRHPAQGVIAISSTTEGALAGSGEDTTAAISLAGDSTAGALGKSYSKTKHVLGRSVREVGKALRVTPREAPAEPR